MPFDSIIIADNCIFINNTSASGSIINSFKNNTFILSNLSIN